MDMEITVALIGAAGVCGTIVGTVVGARIQAHSGHAQAQAARDAAATAAQAARRQALQELRWTTLTALLRAAGECMEATEQLYTSSQARVDAELTEVKRVYRAFRLVHAEAELAAPPGMEGVLAHMNRVVMGAYDGARMRAPTERALQALDELSREGDPAAMQAKEALTRLRRAGAPLWSPHRGDPPPEYEEVIEALNAVPRLDRHQVRLLLANAVVPLEYERSRLENVRGALQERTARRHAHQDARQKLITAAREALSTNEP
ncbi:hypothetical protein WJ438_00765 [Streptomyces sp. GD-15H]|uniref:hypothetical protein n=1 Tax=Streptomyces sp. GD-15H TaxID=3129112 RepID=UPI00325137CA